MSTHLALSLFVDRGQSEFKKVAFTTAGLLFRPLLCPHFRRTEKLRVGDSGDSERLTRAINIVIEIYCMDLGWLARRSGRRRRRRKVTGCREQCKHEVESRGHGPKFKVDHETALKKVRSNEVILFVGLGHVKEAIRTRNRKSFNVYCPLFFSFRTTAKAFLFLPGRSLSFYRSDS